MKYFLFNLSLLLFIIPTTLFAAGIQVSPAKLDITVTAGQTHSEEIYVANPTADVQIFQVYSDDFTDFVKAAPQSFTLESGARKTVNLNFGAPNEKKGSILNTNISVVSKPLTSENFSTATGVKIPLTITVLAGKQSKTITIWVWPTLILIILLAIYMLRRKFTKNKSGPSENF